MNAEIVIVGAGIAGLRCGIEILHKRPKTTVVVLEKYNYKGGRVTTYKKTLQDVKGKCTHLQWENGAGRVHSSHTKVLDLIKQYKLTTTTLSSEQFYADEGISKFEDLMKLFQPSIEEFQPSILATHTLRELFQMLLKEKANEFLLMFPYRSEMDTLRADLGLQSFETEMGSYEGYISVKEGLSSIIQGMVKEFEDLGGHIFLNQTVSDIQKDGELYLVHSKTKSGDVVWEAKQVICALHVDAIKEIPCFSNWSITKHLKMEPLLRVYAVFPTVNGKAWFSAIGRTVFPGPLRYFIPINPSCGTVMLSYTDGKDAQKLLQILSEKKEEGLEDFLLKTVRQLFPQHTIPEPLFFKAHPWYQGCTYWLPGDYSPEKLSEEALQPFPKTMPGLYCCGESFSLKQAWMEGALEHADQLLKKFF